ncbi:glycosyl transferase [Dactylosporangium cerinum]
MVSPVKTGGKNALVVVSYVVFSVVLFQHLWAAPQTRMLADNNQDQVFFEWVLTHAARFFTHGDSPIFTDQLNAPLGVNLMANTSILGLALPLAPITLLFGAPVTFALISTIAPAATSIAWFFMLVGCGVVRSRTAAYLGALFCGFGPAMVSQTTAHPNIAGQFMIPLILWAVFRMRTPGNPVRKGLVLAGLVVYQCFINEEVLFLAAFALLVFLLVFLRPGEMLPAARAALPALGVTALAAGAVMAYPLWHQFAGPQAYHGLPDHVHGFSADLAGFYNFSRRSILGDATLIDKLGGPTEENTFFGWPLLLLLPAAAAALWRERAARAVFVTAVVFALLSLGPVARYQGEETTWHGPWRWLVDLPLFDSVVPTRVALVVTPLVGVLLAILVDRFIVVPPVTRAGPALAVAATAPAGPPAEGSFASEAPAAREVADPDDEPLPVAGRWLWAAALAMALVPLVPTPQPANERPAAPIFFSSGVWRQHVPDQATVVVIPGGWWEGLDAMRWAVDSNLDFKIAGGYFLAPDPNDPERKAMFGPLYPQTWSLLGQVGNDGVVPQLGPEYVAQAKADLAYWKADRIILADGHGNSDAIRQTADLLFGPGEHVEDVWVWKVS